MAQLWQLFQLGQTDGLIDKKKKEKEELETPTKLEEEKVKLEEEMTRLKESLKELHLKMKKLEIETDGYVEHRKKLEKKIYSGKTTNPKELQNWQTEIQHLKKKQNEKEELQIELMEEQESLETSIENSNKSIKDKEKEIKAAWKQYKSENKRLEEEIEKLLAKREKILPTLEPAELNRYEKLRLSTQDGIAVVKITSNSCGGCFMSIPMSMIRKVQAHELVTCNNCMRILYWETK